MKKTQITLVSQKVCFRDFKVGRKKSYEKNIVIEGQLTELSKYAVVAIVTTVPWHQKFSRVRPVSLTEPFNQIPSSED